MVNYSGLLFTASLIPQANISITGSSLLALAAAARSRSFETCPHHLGGARSVSGLWGSQAWPSQSSAHPTLFWESADCRLSVKSISSGTWWTWVQSSSAPHSLCDLRQVVHVPRAQEGSPSSAPAARSTTHSSLAPQGRGAGSRLHFLPPHLEEMLP